MELGVKELLKQNNIEYGDYHCFNLYDKEDREVEIYVSDNIVVNSRFYGTLFEGNINNFREYLIKNKEFFKELKNGK